MLSVYGQQHFTTPHIDTLIRHGVSFTYAVGGAVSTHARASFLTGYSDCSKRQKKWHITGGGVYTRDDSATFCRQEEFADELSLLLPENDLYLPQVFRTGGYATAQIGMLGWGELTTRRQMFRHGWDYFYGYLDHTRSYGHYPKYLFENEYMTALEGNTRIDGGRGFAFETESEAARDDRRNMEGKKVYAPDALLGKAIAFIREFRDQPFFLMYAPPLPGAISIPSIHPEVAGNDALTPIEQEYASMVKLLDDQVGAVMAELRRLGLEEKTLVAFAADNGHEIYYLQENRISRPFRNVHTGEAFDHSYSKYYSRLAGDVFNGNMGLAGLKRSNLNGGILVPLAFYRKGRLSPHVSDEIVAGYDFLPTMADLLNVRLKAEKDGVSLLPVLTKGGKVSGKRFVAVSSSEGPAIVMNDGWKLRYFNIGKKYELYDIRKDPEEKYDVILRYPDKAEKLKKLLLEQCNGSVENGTVY